MAPGFSAPRRAAALVAALLTGSAVPLPRVVPAARPTAAGTVSSALRARCVGSSLVVSPIFDRRTAWLAELDAPVGVVSPSAVDGRFAAFGPFPLGVGLLAFGRAPGWAGGSLPRSGSCTRDLDGWEGTTKGYRQLPVWS
jgi:hypothetical protein